jgi:hypothetical protein
MKVKNRASNFILVLLCAAMTSSWNGHAVGLISDSYGIVTHEDLEIEKKRCSIHPHFPSQSGCYNYWQCLPVDGLKISCVEVDINDDGEERAELSLIASQGEFHHQYKSHQRLALEYCEQMVKEIFALTSDEKHLCLAGSYLGQDIETELNRWTIDKAKSLKGSWSYF